MKKSLVESIQDNLNEDEVNNEDLLEQMANWLRENPQSALGIARDINGYDGSLEELDYWENDEEFFNTYYPDKPMDAVRAACYGSYNYMDDYVRIDVYGNLESVSEMGLEEEVKAWAADILEQIIDNYDKYQGSYVLDEIPEEFKALLEKYMATRPGLSESIQNNLNETNDNTKYIVCSYYDEKVHGLEDELKTNDWSEATSFAYDKLMNGFMVEIENTITGKYKRINPDEYNEEFDGEFIVRPEELEEAKENNLKSKKSLKTESKFDKVQATLPLDNFHSMGIIVSDDGETVQYMYSNDENSIYESEIEYDEEGNPYFKDKNDNTWYLNEFMRT